MRTAPDLGLVFRFSLLAIAWGCSFLFIKIALEGLTPSQVVLGRLVLGALTLGVVVLVGRHRLPRDPTVWLHLGVVTLFLCVIPFSLFAVAETQISSGLASIFNATTPLLTGLIAFMALPKERLDFFSTAGILLGFTGVAVVVDIWNVSAGDSQLTGQLLCLGATTCYGIGFVWLRRFVSPRGLPAAPVAFIQVVLGAVVVLLAAPFISLTPITMTPRVASSMLALGALSTGLAYLWNTQVVTGWGATAASSVTYLTPVVGVIAGIMVLGESPSWNQPVGGLIIIAGVMLSRQREIRAALRR